MPPIGPAGPPSRDEIRARVKLSRQERSQAQQLTDDRARNARALELIASLVSTEAVVACYLSRAGEPGTLELIGQLAESRRVLVPKLGPLDDGTARRLPDWAWFNGTNNLVDGPFGIPDPAGPGLGSEALGMADLVIVAALCAGPDGSRIGTGAGWFDRALELRRAGTPVVALLNDTEVVRCPQQPHDVPVDWLVTPSRTIRCAAAWT